MNRFSIANGYKSFAIKVMYFLNWDMVEKRPIPGVKLHKS